MYVINLIYDENLNALCVPQKMGILIKGPK